MPESLFGPLFPTHELEKAIEKVYSLWCNEYLAELERQQSIHPKKSIPRPPTPESIHGGIDFENWIEEELPVMIIKVTDPVGEVEYHASEGYTACYEVQVGCIVKAEEEDVARKWASYYGAVSMLLVQQGGNIGSFVERTRLVTAPKIEFVDPEERRLARAVTTFHIWISELIVEDAGPVQPEPKESPEYKGKEEPYGEEPIAETVETTVVAKKISEKV